MSRTLLLSFSATYEDYHDIHMYGTIVYILKDDFLCGFHFGFDHKLK
jgi:hypothetical protein